MNCEIERKRDREKEREKVRMRDERRGAREGKDTRGAEEKEREGQKHVRRAGEEE